MTDNSITVTSTSVPQGHVVRVRIGTREMIEVSGGPDATLAEVLSAAAERFGIEVELKNQTILHRSASTGQTSPVAPDAAGATPVGDGDVIVAARMESNG